jgi:DNA-binding transcriptional regulator LsrR (DeoR family)
MPTYEALRLINTILTLYYVDGVTQSEIAQRMGLSTAKVNRLLQQARELGYVNITIRTPFQHLFDLEARLKAVFGLQDAIVIPSVAGNSSSLMNPIGAVAVNTCSSTCEMGMSGYGGGTAVNAVVMPLNRCVLIRLKLCRS